MTLRSYLESVGGVSTRTQLIAAGFTDAMLRTAIRRGQLQRIGRGSYRGEHPHPEMERATRAGGRLACQSALAARGVWVLADDRLHVSLAPDSARRPQPGICHHRRRLRAPRGESQIQSPLEALEQLHHCASSIASVISIDSAINLGLVRKAEVANLIGTTVRGRWVLDRVDGRSQSGTETIARVALRGRNVRLRPQVKIVGVGNVDLVVGDRLVIELDSRKWHHSENQYEEDRRRDAALVSRGYLVMRFTYRRVVHDWASVEREILAVVRRGDHHWSRGRRRQPD